MLDICVYAFVAAFRTAVSGEVSYDSLFLPDCHGIQRFNSGFPRSLRMGR